MIDNFQIYSIITCAGCGNEHRFRIPNHATRTMFECPGCRQVHKTAEGECCIFCRYGSVPCKTGQTAAHAEGK